MNESAHNLTNSAGVRSEMGDQTDGHAMSVDSVPSISMMQSTVLTDLQLIYMLQQQQQQGGAGEATMMLSPGSFPLLMSSCQVMALHPSISQQFVSSSSTGTSPSSLARSPLLASDGSIIWHPAANDDHLSDNFDEDHHQGTSFSQQGNGGLGQQTASPVVISRNVLQMSSHQQQQQLLTVNGSVAAAATYPGGYSVVNAASTVGHSSGFVASAPSKIIVTTPPKTSLAAPKKPLTPYMKFSKSIWQHVKNANPSMSVCEVGASIGRLWREMVDTEKQKYNDEFQREKAVYEVELQTYLRATGLQVSDLAKSKKKDTRDRSKASNNAATMPNQNYAKTVLALPLSNSIPVTLAGGREGDAEGTRLPHISQMWLGHSVTQQPQAPSQVQNILKTVCNPFETGRLKTVDVNNQSMLQERDAHSSPGAPLTVVSNEMLSGMSWTWMKAVDSVTNDPSRSFSLEAAMDSSQSAYAPQDQGGTSLGAMVTLANQQQQPVMEFYSASDSLEPGEVVVEGFQPTLMAKIPSSPQNGSITSAHNMYNSYAVNPWNRYKLAAGPKAVEAIFDREHILHTELVHLRGSLSEKTKEVEQLSKELEVAYELIGKLQQQDNPPPHSVPEESAGDTLHLMDRSYGKEEPSDNDLFLRTDDMTQILQNDVSMRREESALEEEGLKKELNPDVKPAVSEERDVASACPPGIGNLLSTRASDDGHVNPDRPDDCTESSSVGDQTEDVDVASSHPAALGTLPEYSMPGRGHQVIQQHEYEPTTNNVEITTKQRIVVAQFPDERNVTLQFESSMQREERQAEQNQELETEEVVASNRQEGISDEPASTSCFTGEELKDSGVAVTEEVVSGPGEMVLPP